MTYRACVTTVFIALFALVSAAQASGADMNPPAFTEIEKKVIEEYILKHPELTGRSAASAGHKEKGRKALPPGIAKNLQRGKPLPPGIAKNYLPSDLVVELPKRPGYERVIIDGRVILIEIATGIVRDILEDVLFPD